MRINKVLLSVHVSLGAAALLILFGPAHAQTVGATIDETSVQRNYYVAADSTASDSSDGLSWATAFATLQKAVTTARANSLAQGLKTKIWMAEGTYTGGYGSGLGVGDTWPGHGTDTVLIIEGQGTGGATLSGRNLSLYFPSKSNLVLRNITVTGAGGNFGIPGAGVAIDGNAHKDYRFNNALLENVKAIGCLGRGIDVDGEHHVTLRRCIAKNNNGEGMLMIGRWNRSENCVVTGNNYPNAPADNRGGFYFIGQDCIVDHLNSSNNRGTGFRCDFQAKNVTLTNSTFNNNFGIGTDGTGTDHAAHGITFEIAEGPIAITHCQAVGNSGSGLAISTSHNITVDGCTLKDNKMSQVEVTVEGNRRDGVVYTDTQWFQGWVTDASGKLVTAGNRTISDVLKTTIKNSTLTTTRGSTSRIFWNENNSDAGYREWAVSQFTGSNNTYFNDATQNAFLRNGSEYVDLPTWRIWTKTDTDSTWGTNSHPVVLTEIKR